jgi:hypothetical protein
MYYEGYYEGASDLIKKDCKPLSALLNSRLTTPAIHRSMQIFVEFWRGYPSTSRGVSSSISPFASEPQTMAIYTDHKAIMRLPCGFHTEYGVLCFSNRRDRTLHLVSQLPTDSNHRSYTKGRRLQSRFGHERMSAISCNICVKFIKHVKRNSNGVRFFHSRHYRSDFD